jgi:hypothetical protein
MTEHERLFWMAKEAIDAVFSDTSVSPQGTIDALQDLCDHCQMSIDAIECDLKREE